MTAQEARDFEKQVRLEAEERQARMKAEREETRKRMLESIGRALPKIRIEIDAAIREAIKKRRTLVEYECGHDEHGALSQEVVSKDLENDDFHVKRNWRDDSYELGSGVVEDRIRYWLEVSWELDQS